MEYSRKRPPDDRAADRAFGQRGPACTQTRPDGAAFANAKGVLSEWVRSNDWLGAVVTPDRLKFFEQVVDLLELARIVRVMKVARSVKQ